MSRSERSRQGAQRTAEERERDRQEREARRAGRGRAEQPAPQDPEFEFAQQSPEPEPEPGLALEIPETELAPQSPEPEFAPEIPEPEVAPQTAEPEIAAEIIELEPAPQILESEPASEITEPEVAPQIPEPEPELLDPPAAESQTSLEELQPLPPLPPELGGPHKALTPRRRSARSLPARLAAVLALALVIVAVVVLVRSLTHTTHTAAIAPAPVVKVLIPEGKTRLQIAEIAAAEHLKGSYRRASQRSPLLDPTQFGAPHHTANLEGFLFPATYELDPGAPVSRLVQEQLIAFREHFGAHDVARARALHVTPYQLLTVASMVEREALIPGDRAKIAAVIYNRLRAGMPLGIDASIYYAVELQKGISTYTHELTETQLHIDSPYNTRTHTGLPPTPISNPGEASIEAAAHPAHVAYLYYVAGADGCGEQVFSDTQAEFEANVASYEVAKQKHGGHPPACKHH